MPPPPSRPRWLFTKLISTVANWLTIAVSSPSALKPLATLPQVADLIAELRGDRFDPGDDVPIEECVIKKTSFCLFENLLS